MGGSPSHSSRTTGSKKVKNTPVAAPAQMNAGQSTALTRCTSGTSDAPFPDTTTIAPIGIASAPTAPDLLVGQTVDIGRQKVRLGLAEAATPPTHGTYPA